MILGIFKIFGILIYIYLVWRNLRDDYKDDELVEFGWLSILLMLVGGRIVYGLIHWGVWNSDILDWWYFWNKPGFDFFGAVMGWLLAVYLYAKTKGNKFFSFGNDNWPQLVVLMELWLVDELIRTKLDLNVVWQIVIWAVAAGVFWWGEKKYRSLSWFKSGKKGFAVLMANIVWGMSISIVSIITGGGLAMIILGGTWSLISVVGLVMLSRI